MRKFKEQKPLAPNQYLSFTHNPPEPGYLIRLKCVHTPDMEEVCKFIEVQDGRVFLSLIDLGTKTKILPL